MRTRVDVFSPGDPRVGIPSVSISFELPFLLKDDRDAIRDILVDAFSKVFDDQYTSVALE